MNNEWPSLLAAGDKIVIIIAFERRFLVELQPRSSWQNQETLEILPSDGVVFYTDGLLCESRVGACVLSKKESYALCTLAIASIYTVYGLSNRGRYMQFLPVLTTVGAFTCTT
jgi:hypothetical protein